jgi:hypothetical protein
MARYFAGTRALLACRGAGAFEWQTTAGSPTRFNSAIVAGAMGVSPLSNQGASDVSFLQIPLSMDAASTTGTLWGHFECLVANAANGTVANISRFLSWVNTSGVTIAEVVATASNANTFYFRYWNGSAFVQSGATFTLTATARISFDFRLAHGASGTFDLWVNGALVITVSGMNAAVNNTTFVRLHSGLMSTTLYTYYSQVALADFDLRSYVFSSDVLAAFATYNEGTGVVGGQSDMDLTTVYTLPANGNRVTGTIAARTLPGGSAIRSVQVTGLARVNSPIANMQGLLRLSSTDYASANVTPAPNGGFEFRAAYWDNNPNTAAAWAVADFNAGQFGFKAVT